MDRIEYIRQINMRLNELEAKVEAIEEYLQNISEDIMYLKMEYANMQEVKHGEWLEIPHKQNVRCSVCNKVNDSDNCDYCPFCGAKMDGGK